MPEQKPQMLHETWYSKAHENVDKWGVQHPAVVLLAMQEEMGELSQAWLEATYEDGDPDRAMEELHDIGALLTQLVWALREHPAPYSEVDGL